MTTNNPVRRSRRVVSASSYGASGNGHRNGHLTVGERLRDARELRGLDLYRVERDTKIRYKFLVALEAGDYADLPGDVYARGFLRNYATYLGLDPDEVIDDWRRESGPPGGQASILNAPRPIVLARRGFFLQTSHMVLIAVVLIVAIVGVYFAFQVSRFLSYPTLAVGCPGASPSPAAASQSVSAQAPSVPGLTVDTSGATSCYMAQDGLHITSALGATTYNISGTATAGATVSIVWNGHDPKTATVDDGGNWSYQAIVMPGQNEFDVTAQNIDTNHSSKTVKIFLYVPSPTPTPTIPVVAFSSPEDGTVFSDGTVAISGTSSFVTAVTLTATYLGTPPGPGATLSPDLYATPGLSGSAVPGGSAGASASATPRATSIAAATPAASATASGPISSPPAAPPPVQTTVDDKGAFTFTLTLDPGVWRLSIAGQDSRGTISATVSRVVAVPFTGVVVDINVKGSAGAWMVYYRDGVALGSSTYKNGYSVTISAKKSVCINTAKPSNVFLTVNGVNMGSVAQYSKKLVYIDATHPPKSVSSC